MRPILPLFLFSLISLPCMAETAPPDWENQAVFRVGTEPPRATSFPAPSPEGDPFVQSLNGEWKFHYTGHPDHRPRGIESDDFDDSAWDTIPVPSNWQLHGHGIPLYSNIPFPFHVDPPRVMGEPPPHFTNAPLDQRNPVGSYRHTFTVPADWDGREVFITFHGIDSAAYVWLNGHRLGYTQDSRTPAEFRLTDHLRTGPNLLAVEVYQLSDGSYLEDQDMWRLSGIFRDVVLWSSARVTVRDFEARATYHYEQGTSGTLDLDTVVHNATSRAVDATLTATLTDPHGNELLSISRQASVSPENETPVPLSMELEHVEPWSAEAPNLYTLNLALRSPGQAPEYRTTRIGFRTVKLKKGQFLVNGQPIYFKGVNRHDHDPVTGHYVPSATLRRDLLEMKRLNINAIRTSHYPNMPELYALADELGFYVWDEANIETHGLGWQENPLAEDASWFPAKLARIQAMVERDKNHPSVVLWSMGNESGHGENFERLAAWIHERDSSRLVQYDRAQKRPYVDIFSNMYHHPDKLLRYARDEEKKPLDQQRPAILCEYNHAMGNSSGNFADYWERIRAERLLQGGFIWDFKDQGLRHTWQTPEGPRTGYAYGGDFGDAPNDGSFCLNGIVQPDHTWSPQAWEVRKVYQDIWTTFVGALDNKVELRVRNDRFFRPIEAVEGSWSLTRDGREIAKGEFPVPIVPPQEFAHIVIDLGEQLFVPESEYHLRIGYRLAQSTPWANAGFEIAWDQVALPLRQRLPPSFPSTATTGGLEHESAEGDVFKGELFEARFDARGRLVSYEWNGREMLAAPLQLDFWRAPTNNDEGRKLHEEAVFWKSAADALVVAERSGRMVNDRTTSLDFHYTIGEHGSRAHLRYTIHASGEIMVELVDFSPAAEDGPEVPRIGLRATLPAEFDQWSWFGRGPHENYIDRHTGAWVGVFEGTVDELFFRYLDPQEAGNRTGVRWARFDAPGQHGLTFAAGDHLLEVSAKPFTDGALETATHPHELPPPGPIVVHLDYGQTGLGGTNSWGAKPLDPYRLFTGQSYAYRFFIRPPTKD